MRRHCGLAALGLLALVLFGSSTIAQFSQPGLAQDRLTIVTAAGVSHEFDVELALTPGEQAQGLMFRRKLARDAGMLFLYKNDRPRGMWMKNTVIPLDMIFIEADGRILKVVERTVPQSLETIESGGPARAVLEINGGTASRLEISVGDKVVFPGLNGEP